MAGKNPLLDGALRVLRQVANRALDRTTRPGSKRSATRQRPKPTQSSSGSGRTRSARDEDTRRKDTSGPSAGGYPGDFTGTPVIVYQPSNDDRPDPGEVVWTWVPYEEDHQQGKDRPVLLLARDGSWLLGLQVTSQDHDRDRDQEARAERHWIDIGRGAWDSQGRPSEARVNRIIRIDPDTVRRIGAILEEEIFRDVAREVLRHY